MSKTRAKTPKPTANKDLVSEQVAHLRAAGFIQHARDFERAVHALRVIHTWATYRGGYMLVPEQVKNLAARSLGPWRSK